MSFRTTSFLFLVLVSLFSCQSDTTEAQKEQIIGRWEIREAYRNGRPTESLAQLYFEFFRDGQMNTNLLGTPETARYTLQKNQIKQRESQVDVDYAIEEINDSLLVLTTKLRNFDFRFQLQRNIQEQ